MIQPIDVRAISSFKEYLDHKIVQKLQAWVNTDVKLFEDQKDGRLSGYRKISSGPSQWLYDGSIVGANIANPAQIMSVNPELGKTDFVNGRFLVPNSSALNIPTTVNLAKKHFNVYVSSSDDEELFHNVSFGVDPEVNVQSAAVRAYNYHAPCYFIKYSTTRNEGLAMGGLDRTIIRLRVSCFVKSELDLICIGSVIRDLKNTNTIILNKTPLNEFNDLKERPWNYNSEVSLAVQAGNPIISVDECSFNPIKSDNINSKFKNIYIGLGTVDISIARRPRA